MLDPRRELEEPEPDELGEEELGWDGDAWEEENLEGLDEERSLEGLDEERSVEGLDEERFALGARVEKIA